MTLADDEFKHKRRMLKRLYRLNCHMSSVHAIMGLDITRCFEYTAAWGKLWSATRSTLLDVGSYRSPFPLFLAQEGYHVVSIDINPVIAKQRQWGRRTGVIFPSGQGFLETSIVDAMHIAFAPATFDYVTCISTIEHLSDEGDVITMTEIARVLRPGGQVFLTVPYALTYREGCWGRWFQRDYDLKALESRLVKPSGLIELERGYLLGRPARRFADPLYRLPRLVRHFIGWGQILPALYLLARDRANAQDARVVWLLLQRD